MFNSWFSDKSNRPNNKTGGVVDTLPSNSKPRSSSLSASPHPPQPSVAPDRRKSSSISLTSPHDAAIDHMEDELRTLQATASLQGTSGSDQEAVGVPGESLAPKLRTRKLPENMFDPFDGQSIGLMVQGEFEEAEDDLWTHLSEIRFLQSDIARMHAQMGKLGEIGGRTGQAMDDDAINMEDDAKAVKAAEFAKLSDRFNGRKEAIEAIMQKLDTLSHTINDFHSSRAPIFRSATSQNASDSVRDTSKSGVDGLPSEDGISSAMLHNKLMFASQEDMLKESPESLAHSLHHSDT